MINKTILKDRDELKDEKYIALYAIGIENFKNLKYHTF